MNKKPSFAFSLLAILGACICIFAWFRDDTATDWQKQCLLEQPGRSAFDCHIPVSSGGIYPRLDFKSVPSFPCNDRNQNLASCFFDELMAQAPPLIGRENYVDYVSRYKPHENNPAPKTENGDLIAKLPREIGGTNVISFDKSLQDVSNLVRRCRDAGVLDEAREVLKDVSVVLPEKMEYPSLAQLNLYEFFTILGLPERAEHYRQQVLDSKIVIGGDSWYDLLVATAHADKGKEIDEFLKRYKTEAEQGYQSASIIRSLLRSDKDNFETVKKLWPYAIGWCMQRNVDADIGRPITGFYHDEYIPNTYPACLIKLLPNHSFSFSLRGH